MGNYRFNFAAALAASLVILFFGALLGQIAEKGDWPPGGLEFWLHRYQTGLTALVAIVGLVGVSNQIVATRRQTRAALQQAHKADLTALAMARSNMNRLKNHAEFSKDFRIGNGAFGAPTRPPTIDEDLLRQVQSALATTSPNPLGIVDLHESWALACSQLANGIMPLDHFLLYADEMIAEASRTAETLDHEIQKIYAQIDASI